MTASIADVSCCSAISTEETVRVTPEYTQKRPDGHIKRPMNAFMVWSQIQRAKIVKERPSMHNAAISKQLGSAWKELSPDERLPYIIESQRLKRIHKQQYPDYKYRPKKRCRKDEGEQSVPTKPLTVKQPSPPSKPTISKTPSNPTRHLLTSPRPIISKTKAVEMSDKMSDTPIPVSTSIAYNPRKRTRHIITTEPTAPRPTYSLPQIKRKRSLKIARTCTQAKDRFEFVESTLPQKSPLLKR